MKKSTKLLILLSVLLAISIGMAAYAAAKLIPEHRREVAAEEARLEQERIEYAKQDLKRTVSSYEELSELDRYENLKTLDLSGSSCYDDILRYMDSHPSVEVTYTLPVDGNLVLGNEAADVLLTDPAQLEKLSALSPYLPKLNKIIIEKSGFSSEELSNLMKAFPNAGISFSFSPEITDISPNQTDLNLVSLTPEYVENAAGFLSVMSNMETVALTDDNGGNSLALDQFKMLLEASPEADYDYRFVSFGVPVCVMDEAIEYYGNSTGLIYNEGLEEIEAMLPCMPRLASLYFEYCEIDYDLLAEFRDRHPEINIVWRINFGPYSCRTDREMIFANGSLTTELCENLKYCNKVRYIDLGHNEGIRAVEFVRGMPELEVAIFAVGGLQDVSPLAECPRLRYLEIFLTDVSDLSPLSACTELEHLNISYTDVTDITPLYSLTKLQRMWYAGGGVVPRAAREEIQELLPDCVFHFGGGESTGNHWRFNNDGSRVEPYEEISQIFGYDNWRATITYW